MARLGRACQSGNQHPAVHRSAPGPMAPAQGAVAKSPGLRSFGHAYPGRLEQVQRVRAELGAILNGCPIADETILVASELAANAPPTAVHASPTAGSSSAQRYAPVTTYGSKSRTRATPGAGHHPRDGRPHGLDIVQAIAGDGNWGIDGAAALGRVAWARLDWPNR